MNPSRKHFFTHVKKESQGVTGLGLDAKPAKFNVDEVLKLMSQGPGD